MSAMLRWNCIWERIETSWWLFFWSSNKAMGFPGACFMPPGGLIAWHTLPFFPASIQSCPLLSLLSVTLKTQLQFSPLWRAPPNSLGRAAHSLFRTACELCFSFFKLKKNFRFKYSLFTILFTIYNAVIISAVLQSAPGIRAYPFFFRFFSHIDHHRILGRVLCAI